MFRVRMIVALVLALAGLSGSALIASAGAGNERQAASSIQARNGSNEAAHPIHDLSAQQARKRRGTKLQVYRRGPLGPNAKRECYVRYVQDYRPSGTVIVPRMQCWWING